jgi:hypothetical protein
MKKLLVLLTTHMSASHMRFLHHCWPRLLNEPLFRDADFHFYVTPDQGKHGHADSSKRHTNLVSRPVKELQRIIPRARVTQSSVAGKQHGAQAPMHDMRMNTLFEPYDWVMRLNPDVVVYNTTKFAALMDDSNVDAIMGNCSSHPTVRFMTDFSIFRPRTITWTENTTSDNAETDFTNILSSRNYTIFYQTPGKACRIQDWGTVVHEHDHGRRCSQWGWARRHAEAQGGVQKGVVT